MRKRVATMGLACVAALAIVAPSASASSHREAPLITQDPVADLNDLYAWVDEANPAKIDFVVTANPLEEAGDAPNYYGFGEHVRYDLNIDTNGDSIDDLQYRFTFTTHVKNGSVFLYNVPGNPVTTLNDSGLNVTQTYTVQKIRTRPNGSVLSQTTLARGLPVVPNNVGPASMPNFAGLVSAGVRSIGGGTTKVWAGQSDDPFFLGLADIGDSLSIRPQGKATDTVGGYNTQAIVLQVPKAGIVKPGHPTIGIYASTERQALRNVLTGAGSGPWRQIERLGNPLVNEVIIGLKDKDHWNQVEPRTDSQFNSYFTSPILGAALGVPNPRQDLRQVLELGVPKLNVTGGPVADLLRLNTSIPPAADMAHENKLGVLGGDNAGYPNGRRLGDDVVDIELKVVAGALLGKDVSGVSDGVQSNDEPFSSAFPFLGRAQSGPFHNHHLPTGP